MLTYKYSIEGSRDGKTFIEVEERIVTRGRPVRFRLARFPTQAMAERVKARFESERPDWQFRVVTL